MGQNKRVSIGKFITSMCWMSLRTETTASGAERKTWEPTSVFLADIESESHETDTSEGQRREVFSIVFVSWYKPVGVDQQVRYNGKRYAISSIEPLENRLYGRYTCKTDGYADSES